ncbi:hypothetical protein MTR67_031064 [Solanum verrucosum]|uniref:Tf2-1-like SH3-like domain-containing protein n=1 Tax=Solanum verrucosum TaxID=315347 RepID=A0AAF0U1T1_SOLVR|nr:hypothetical protein MTR67_031064 [Solanum verrucosum]
MRFGKKGKLSPRYVGPYHSLKRIGKVAYELDLPNDLALVHPVFHVSSLKNCVGDPTSIIPLESLSIKDSLSDEEVSVVILDWKIWKLRNKDVVSVKYALTMVSNSRERISKCFSGVSDLVVKECHTAILIKEMDISCFMIHAQQIEEERAKESKRERTSDDDFSHSRSTWRPQFRQKISDQDFSNASTSTFNKDRVSTLNLKEVVIMDFYPHLPKVQ